MDSGESKAASGSRGKLCCHHALEQNIVPLIVVLKPGDNMALMLLDVGLMCGFAYTFEFVVSFLFFILPTHLSLLFLFCCSYCMGPHILQC